MSAGASEQPATEKAWSGPRRISVLGATGSVGQSTLDLVSRSPEKFEVVALTGHSNPKRLAELAITSDAQLAVVGDEAC